MKKNLKIQSALCVLGVWLVFSELAASEETPDASYPVNWVAGDLASHPEKNWVYMVDETGDRLLCLDCAKGTVASVVVSPDSTRNSRLAVSHDHSAVYVSTPATRRLHRFNHGDSFELQQSWNVPFAIASFIIGQDGLLYAICSESADGSLIQFDLESKLKVSRVSISLGSPVKELAYCNEKEAIVIHAEGDSQIFSIRENRLELIEENHSLSEVEIPTASHVRQRLSEAGLSPEVDSFAITVSDQLVYHRARSDGGSVMGLLGGGALDLQDLPERFGPIVVERQPAWTIGAILGHPRRSTVFLVDETHSKVLELNTVTGVVDSEIDLPSAITGSRLALSPDGDNLYLIGSDQQLHVFSIIEDIALEWSKPLPFPISSFLVGADRHIYAINPTSALLSRIDPASGIAKVVLPDSQFQDKSLLAQDRQGKRLYIQSSKTEARTSVVTLGRGPYPATVEVLENRPLAAQALVVDEDSGQLFRQIKGDPSAIDGWFLERKISSRWTTIADFGPSIELAHVSGSLYLFAAYQQALFRFEKQSGKVLKVMDFDTENEASDFSFDTLTLASNGVCAYLRRSGEQTLFGTIGLANLQLPESAPLAPQELTGSLGQVKEKVALSWAPSIGADSYEVSRSDQAPDSSWQVIGTSSSTRFDDSTVDDGVYQYRVRSINPSGHSPYSDIALGSRLQSHSDFLVSAGDMTVSHRVGVLDFGDLALDGSKTQSLKIKNISQKHLKDLKIEVTGDSANAFQLQRLSETTIGPDQFIYFDITARPPSGTRQLSVDLHITSESGDPYRIGLSAAVVDARMVVSSDSGQEFQPLGSDAIDFGTAISGETVDRSIWVKNTGSTPLRGIQVVITDDERLEYSVESFGMAQLGPGQSAELKLRFAPDGLATRKANLKIYSKDPDLEAFVIPLKGWGFRSRP